MKTYLRTYVSIARKFNIAFILEATTWRASPDWMGKLDYSDHDVVSVNRKCIEILQDVRHEYETENFPIVINATIGP